MIIKHLKLKQHLTRNSYEKALENFFKPKSSLHHPSTSAYSSLQSKPSYRTFLNDNDTSHNSKTNSFSFLTSNLSSSEQIIRPTNNLFNQASLPSLNTIREESKFNFNNEYSYYEKKQRPTTSISTIRFKIGNPNTDSYFSRQNKHSAKTTSTTKNRLALTFPKKTMSYSEKTPNHDVNLFNKRYIEQDPNENYARNAFKVKQLVLGRRFVDMIKKDLTSLKYNNKIKVIYS